MHSKTEGRLTLFQNYIWAFLATWDKMVMKYLPKCGPIYYREAATAAKSLQLCPTLCDPIDVSPPGSPVPGILQARTLEWVAISFSNIWKWKSESELTQSCLTLSNPMDCCLPGSSIHGIFQARVLEWGAIAFSSIQYTNAYIYGI